MNILNRLHIASRFFVVVFCLFILAGLPMASAAQAAPRASATQAALAPNSSTTCSPTAIYITPYFVQIGQTVTLFGCGFQPNAVISITGGGGANGMATVDSQGNFIFSWVMPRHLYKYCYIATASDSLHTATNSFCDK